MWEEIFKWYPARIHEGFKITAEKIRKAGPILDSRFEHGTFHLRAARQNALDNWWLHNAIFLHDPPSSVQILAIKIIYCKRAHTYHIYILIDSELRALRSMQLG